MLMNYTRFSLSYVAAKFLTGEQLNWYINGFICWSKSETDFSVWLYNIIGPHKTVCNWIPNIINEK